MKRYPISTSFLIIIAILSACVLIGTCSKNTANIKPDVAKNLLSEKQLQEMDKKYQSLFLAIQGRCDSLLSELDKTKIKLKVYKLRLGQEEIQVVNLARKDTVGKSVTEKLTDCDSLKKQVVSFVAIVDSTTCAYETSMCQYEDLLATKNAQILICDSTLTQVKDLAQENLIRERKLTENLQTVYKSQRKKTIQNKLLAGGLLILSGITTTLYINSHK